MSDRTVVIENNPPVKSRLIAWTQFVELTGLHPSFIGELIELGWLDPQRTGQSHYLFRPSDVYRVKKLTRLAADLDINLAGASIVVDLLERVEFLENRVRDLEQLI